MVDSDGKKTKDKCAVLLSQVSEELEALKHDLCVNTGPPSFPHFDQWASLVTNWGRKKGGLISMRKYDDAQNLANLSRAAGVCLKVVKNALAFVQKPNAETALLLNVSFRALVSAAQTDREYAQPFLETLAQCYHARNCLAEALGHFASGNALAGVQALSTDRLGSHVEGSSFEKLQRQSLQSALEQVFEKGELNATSVQEVNDGLVEIVGVEFEDPA